MDEAETSERRTTPSPSSAASPTYRADWYPDPTTHFEFRYHNGVSWTGDVATDGQRYLDPLFAAAVTAFGQASGPSVGPSFVPRVGPQRRTGSATAAMILGIGAVVVGWVPFVFVFGLAAGIVAIVLAVGFLRREKALSVRATDGARTRATVGLVLASIGLALCGVGLWLSVVAWREVDRFINIGAHSTEDVRCDVSDGRVTYTGYITNLSDNTRDYHLEFVFTRPGSDNRLYTASADLDGVAPRERRMWNVQHAVSEDRLDCTVQAVTGPVPFGQS